MSVSLTPNDLSLRRAAVMSTKLNTFFSEGNQQSIQSGLLPGRMAHSYVELKQDKFVVGATRTPGVQQNEANKLYFELWPLHIVSRALLRGELVVNAPGPNKREPLQISGKKSNNTIQKNSGLQPNINPGDFFRLVAQAAKKRIHTTARIRRWLPAPTINWPACDLSLTERTAWGCVRQ